MNGKQAKLIRKFVKSKSYSQDELNTSKVFVRNLNMAELYDINFKQLINVDFENNTWYQRLFTDNSVTRIVKKVKCLYKRTPRDLRYYLIPSLHEDLNRIFS